MKRLKKEEKEEKVIKSNNINEVVKALRFNINEVVKALRFNNNYNDLGQFIIIITFSLIIIITSFYKFI